MPSRRSSPPPQPPPSLPRRRRAVECRRVRPQAEEVDTQRPDAAVARLAERDFGVVSIAELRACGLSDDAVLARVRSGRLHLKHRGVYAVGHPNVPLEGRFLAAVKACGSATVVSHFAAAVLWALVEWDHRDVDVTVPGPGTRLHRGVRTHRSRCLDEVDLRRVKGIPVTSPARTLLDCAAIMDPKSLRRAVREAEGRGLVTVDELASLLLRLPRRRGARKLASIIATGPAPTRSVLEDVVLGLLLRGGFAHPDVNVPLDLDGRRVVPDFRWPSARLVLEADGAAWHDHRLAREDDAERQALLEAAGEHVVRVTWAQAMGRPAQTHARLRAAGAPLA